MTSVADVNLGRPANGGSILLPSLYDHQGDMRDSAREAISRFRRVILTAPPGTGKTRVAKWILGAAANKEITEKQSGHVLFAVHRRGLVSNASNSFGEDPELEHGIVMSGVKPTWGNRVHVASIDTLLSWFVKNNDYDTSITFDLIIFDETHSHLSKLQKFLKYHDAMRAELGKAKTFVLGLTATPQAKGLAKTYGEIVRGPSTQWLIDNNFLAPFRYFQGKKGRLDLLKKSSTGNFTASSEAAAFDGYSGDMVRDWKKFAEGRPTVGFFPVRAQAQEAAAILKQASIKTAYVDGDTPDVERERIFWSLQHGHIDYLCNVQVVERGTDIPAIGCVQLCVAIGTKPRFLQMIGRGSRVCKGKTDCLVLDHGGNISRHGFFEDEIHWSLDMSESTAGDVAPRESVVCPQCAAIYRGGRCSNCGYEPPKSESTGKQLAFDGQEMREVTNKTKAKATKSVDTLMTGALYAAGKCNGSWKTACAIFKKAARAQGTPEYKVPPFLTIGGNRYRMIPFGSTDSHRRVSQLYPFTVSRGDHSGPYHLG